MSPHGLLQEYLNLTEDLFADFAVLFRLVHATRLPASHATAPASLVEKYHQDAMDQVARIRDGLSKAVEKTILGFANGFLTHPDNDALRALSLYYNLDTKQKIRVNYASLNVEEFGSVYEYKPTGLSDLVAFFVKRIFSLLRSGGFTAFITTNSIKDGDIRKDGLEQVLISGGDINFAVRGIKWPGLANLVVALVAIKKGVWKGRRVLDGQDVSFISAFFEDTADSGDPVSLSENNNCLYVKICG